MESARYLVYDQNRYRYELQMISDRDEFNHLIDIRVIESINEIKFKRTFRIDKAENMNSTINVSENQKFHKIFKSLLDSKSIKKRLNISTKRIDVYNYFT